MKLTQILIFIVSLALVGLAFYFQQQLSHFRSFGILGILLINFFGSATLFLPAPAIASVVAGGFVYPPIFVAIAAALGSTAGDMLGYLLGQSGKHVLIRKEMKIGGHTLSSLFKKYADMLIFFFALIPNPAFDAIGILAGVLSYSPYRFFVLLFLGRMVRDILLAYAGQAISLR